MDRPDPFVPLSKEAMEALEDEWLEAEITAPLRPEASTRWCCRGECCRNTEAVSTHDSP